MMANDGYDAVTNLVIPLVYCGCIPDGIQEYLSFTTGILGTEIVGTDKHMGLSHGLSKAIVSPACRYTTMNEGTQFVEHRVELGLFLC